MTNVPKIVLSRLRSQAADPHPDADLLTAFAEQSLNGGERSHVMEHIARCGDCREVVALALPALALPGEEEMVVVHPGRSAAGWLSWPVLRWGLITAGILAVTSVGVVQYQRRHEQQVMVATSLQPVEPLRAAENVSSPSPTIPAPTETRMGAATEAKKQSPTSNGVPANALPAGKTHTEANAFSIAARPLPRPGTTKIGGPITGAGTGGGRIAASGQPYSQPDAATEVSSDQVVRVGKAKPAATQTSSRPMAPSPLLHTEASLRKGVAPRWSIGDSGTLRRSADGGRTWSDVNVTADSSMSSSIAASNRAATGKAAETTEVSESAPPVNTDQKSEGTVETPSAPQSLDKARLSYVVPNASGGTIFRALVVSSDVEVWAGGSGGALYHTLDAGNRWILVVPSDGGVLTGDIVGIQFSDAQNGTVRTSTGETWTTLDDGQVWHKQP